MAWIKDKLSSVSLADGISQEEANKLAVCYWTRFCSRCGMPEPVRDSQGYWKARVVTGAIPVRDGTILIDKVTGCISWYRGPTVTNWSRLWE